MRWRFRTLPVFILFLQWNCVTVESGDSLVTREDVLAVIKNNSRVPETLRVTWSITKGRTDAYRRYNQRIVDALEDDIAKKRIEAGQLDGVIEEVAELKDKIAFSKLEHAAFDYWTDFQNFQHRAKKNPQSGAAFGFDEIDVNGFPDILPNHKEVSDSFSTILALSYGPATNRTFRLWQATKQTPYLGVVSPNNPWFNDWHIPLTLSPSEWGGVKNPIDDFVNFFENATKTDLSDIVYLGEPHLLAFATDGKRSVRAFIDMERGGLPVRIEEYPWVLSDVDIKYRQTCLDTPRLAPQFITTIRIDSAAGKRGTYYYPSEGTLLRISVAATEADGISIFHKDKAPHFQATWKYHKIEMDRPMLAESFRLGFPADMIYIDKTLNATYVTGDMEGNMKRIADGAVEFAAKGSSTGRTRMWIMLVVTTALVCAVALRLRKGAIK